MNYDEVFIESNKLPKLLTQKELYSYFEQYGQGDLNAREEIIIHNIKLVLNRVYKKFVNTPYDKKELVSIGLVGLVKSVDTFDAGKKIEFSTYAIRCINNEILMFLRKNKKSANVQSIYTPIGTDKEGNEKKIEDIIEDDTSDFVSDYENKVTYSEVRKVVYSLTDRDREIILLHFGFIDNRTYTHKEIADKFEVSRSYVSRLIAKIIKKIGMQLQSDGFIETIGRSNKENPSASTRTIKRQTYTRKPEVEKDSKLSEIQQLSNTVINLEPQEKETVTPQLITSEEPEKQPSQPSTSEIKKEDCVRILELMRKPSFGEMLKTLTPKEAVIICLKLGYVDGKYFTTESVAGFLGIEKEEVTEITKKVLLLYKENIDKFIDKADEVATGPLLQFSR